MNCFCKIRTCAPSPSSTNSRKDKYTCNRTKDSADNASSSTYNEADSSANEATQYSCFHSILAIFCNLATMSAVWNPHYSK